MSVTEQLPDVVHQDEEEPYQEPGYRAAQLLSSIDGGDVLPEADIVSNIIDKLERWDGKYSFSLQIIFPSSNPKMSSAIFRSFQDS